MYDPKPKSGDINVTQLKSQRRIILFKRLLAQRSMKVSRSRTALAIEMWNRCYIFLWISFA